jgi:HSP20 family protein
MEKKDKEIILPELDKPELMAGQPPFFVEAEKMFDRFAQVSKEIGMRAFDFFRARGGEWGRELDDWFKAETELLRYVPVEITEADGMLKVNAAVPGYTPEDIELSVKDNVLMMSGKTEKKEEKKDENLVYSDLRSDRFFRQFTLPSPVDADKAMATLKDGILHIDLPKATKGEEVTKIAVAAAGK